MVCTERGCTAHPVMCRDDYCTCVDPHSKHSQVRVKGFLERANHPLLSKEVQELSKAMNSIIGMITDRASELRKKHQKHM
jgi:hypothetical protein